MKNIVNALKISFFILFVLLFSINVYSQTVIYQTGFENIPNDTMLNPTVAYDGWLVNTDSVQKIEPHLQFYLFHGMQDDKFRNCFVVSSDWNTTPCGTNSNCLKAIEPIEGQTLGICAYWGLDGHTNYENIMGYYVSSGVADYYENLSTDRWAYRVIPTTGYDSITVSFQWRCNGVTGTETDYGQVGYSTDGGTTWNWLTTGGTANGQYYGQKTINQNATVKLPAVCNNQSNLAIGFRFFCAGNGADQDLNDGYPGFLVDNLFVKGTPTSGCNAVTINTQPVNASACNPGSATFSVTTTGDATISYLWQVNNGTWSNIIAAGTNPIYSNYTTATLTVANPKVTGLTYRCIASNCSPVNYATSDAASLTLSAPVAINPSYYTQTQCVNDSVGFTLTPTSGTGPFSYQWLQNGSPVTDGTGQTSSLFYNNSISESDSGKYTCIISNFCNSQTGDVVYLKTITCPRYRHSISGYVTYDNVAKTPMSSKTAATTTNIYLYNSGDTLIASTQTDNNGYYNFVNIINGTYYVSGNSVKSWGGVNPVDALLIDRTYVHLSTISDTLCRKAGDVNADRKLNVIDALLIDRRYVHLINKFPNGVPDWRFEKIKVVMDGVDLTQNIQAVCYGDVNGSYNTIPGKIICTPVNNEGTMNISTNKQFDIPVYLNTNAELGAIGLMIQRFEDSKIKVLGIKSDIEGLLYNVTDDGINIAWSATDNGITVSPDKPLFMLVAIYSGNQNPEPLQLSPESVIADMDVNTISNDNIIMPKLILNNATKSSFLLSIHPNPFSNITNINYTIPEVANVKLSVYNVLGEKVITLVNGNQQAGQYTLKFDGTNLKQGIYYSMIEAANSTSAYSKTNIMMITR